MPRRVITTPKFATGFVSVTRKTCSGPWRMAVTAPPVGTSGISVARDERGLAARVADVRAGSRQGRHGRCAEGRSGDAEPERDAADVGAARQPDEAGEVAFRRRCCDDRRDLERARDGDGRRHRRRSRRRGRRSSRRRRPRPRAAAGVGQSDRDGLVDAGRTRPKETEAGEARTSGTSAGRGRRGRRRRVSVRRSAPSTSTGLPDPISAALSSATDQDGCRSSSRAAAPAICGLAIDVPDMARPAAAGDGREDRDAGRADVGLQAQRERRRPGGAEVREDAAAGAGRARRRRRR